MNFLTSPPSQWQPVVLAILRITSAYFLLLHGTAKLLGFPHIAFFDNLQLFSLLGLAGVIELVFGVLLLIGLFTRPAAFIASGFAAAAYFVGHSKSGSLLMPLTNGGEAAALFCFIFLYIWVAGPGCLAIDNTRKASAAA